jgi:Ca2+-transporting ATPase
VVAIGRNTEIGKIGKALEGLELESSPLQRETRRAVMIFAAIGLTLCAAVIVLYGVTRDDWLNGVLAGITLAMANLPEEFPLVLTVFLALGAWRISRHRVLTRRAPAIETLGAATILCVDKTGTLTENRMAVQRLWKTRGEIDVRTGTAPEDFHDLVELSVLASEVDPFDPMERAFHTLAQRALPEQRTAHTGRELVHKYPFSSELPAFAQIWRARDANHPIAAAKGAPEAIATLCRLGDAQRDQLLKQVSTMAMQGLRVLAVARADLSADAVGLADPIRATVPDAIRECYQAGIRTVMITGDFPGTAQAIARQIGLAPADTVLTGTDLARLSDPELATRIRTVNIFARVIPEHKLRIVRAFKDAGEIVAMTGDGVNDAPALKAAHIGVAMGGRGTDVAREASSLVLLDDDFTSLVKAVRLGRRIFDNIQKAMCYIVAVHVPTAGLALLPLLVGWPLVLFPVHVVFLEFVIDPACSIVFEAEHSEKDVMRRPPRKVTAHLFDVRMIASSVLQGFGIFAVAAALYGWALSQDTAEGTARAMAFTTVVLGNLGLIVSNRSRRVTLWETLHSGNRALWWVVAATLSALSAALFVPSARNMFQFGAVGGRELMACLIAAVVAFIWFEICKRINPPRAA